MVQSFSGARAALEEVFQYYKVGRYGEAFPEKPYFLLSRCTHVLFSLWLAEQESEQGFFRAASPPTAFLVGLDYGELRYSEYKRRMLHGDLLEEHLTHETKWFEFWMRILKAFDGSSAHIYQEFSQHMLACVRQPGFLEGKAGRKNRKALQLFAKGDETGRVMVRTMSVLENFIRAIVGYFTTPETRTCVLEQTILLTGLLSEIRQIIVWETPATGPYLSPGDPRWRTRSPLRWLSRHRAGGVLMMVPRREGGEIICTFHPAPDSKGRSVSWGRSMTSLKGTYEEELFATWSYGRGEHRDHPDQFPDLKACWTVQNAEAARLEDLSRQIDSLLDALHRNPLCRHLVETVRRISRNDASRWKATVLPWAYVSQLDQLLSQLAFVCREAQALGGDDAAESVIGRLWPSEEATADGGKLGNWQHSRGENASPAVRLAAGAGAPGRLTSTPSPLAPGAQGTPPQVSGPPARFSGQPSTQESGPPLSVPATESAVTAPTESTSGTLASLMQRLRSGQTKDEKNAVREPQSGSLLPEGEDRAKDAEPVNQETPGEGLAVCMDPRDDARVSGESPVRESEQTPEPQSAARQTREAEGEQESTGPQSPGPAEPDGSATEPGSGPSDAAPAVGPETPHLAEAAGAAESAETAADGAVVPAPRELPQPAPAPVTKTADTIPPSGTPGDLVRRLLEYHRCLGETSRHRPRSSGELQRDLGWNQTRLQHAMTSVFGPKPFHAYRSKCEDRTIVTYLEALAREKATGSKGQCWDAPDGPGTRATQPGARASPRHRPAAPGPT